MTPTIELVGTSPSGAALYVVWPPAKCCGCGHAVAAVVNRNGATLCPSCDVKAVAASGVAT
jgi:hypothetical protein